MLTQPAKGESHPLFPAQSFEQDMRNGINDVVRDGRRDASRKSRARLESSTFQIHAPADLSTKICLSHGIWRSSGLDQQGGDDFLGSIRVLEEAQGHRPHARRVLVDELCEPIELRATRHPCGVAG
jgi:hypothetical protein